MLPMRQSYRIIPIYTADVSGVCSALYELGGMTVMHDPSGCNSTYNTHDEIRWYDQDSLIFISGLTEIDAIMGNDRKFIDDIEHAARELRPDRFSFFFGFTFTTESGNLLSSVVSVSALLSANVCFCVSFSISVFPANRSAIFSNAMPAP